MTYDNSDSEVGYLAERLHNQLAKTGYDIWIAPVGIGDVEKLVGIRGPGIGNHVFENGSDIEIVEPDIVDVE